MRERLTSRKNPKIVSALSRVKEGNAFFAEGFHCVEMALSSGLAEEVYSLKEIACPGAGLYLVTPEIIEKLSGNKNPEGIIALCHKKEPQKELGERILFLDWVQDPGNVGAIMRSALAFSFSTIIFSEGSASPYNQKALMAGQGSIFSLNVIQGKGKPEDVVSSLKKDGYSILGSALHGASSLDEANIPNGKLCLILGNEGQGMRESLFPLCDQLLYIPISGIDSLNVAIAGSILMREISKSQGFNSL
ncbi:MAG: RNA methyltransferase [Bacillota bacterium]|nr:RNA methyltransferase [Bacillota bacterium]